MSTMTLPQPVERSLRLALGTIGGYAFANGFIGSTGALLSRLGLAPGEASSIALLVGIFVFAGIVVWAAATTRLLITSAVVVGYALLANLTAPYIAPV
ncbi:MAG: hypothetical protein AAGH41_14405 [Pseudomonadota bacterium]